MLYEASIIVIGMLVSILALIIGIFGLKDSKKLMERASNEGRQSDYDTLNRIKTMSIILISMSSLALFFLIVIPIASKVMSTVWQVNIPIANPRLYGSNSRI